VLSLACIHRQISHPIYWREITRISNKQVQLPIIIFAMFEKKLFRRIGYGIQYGRRAIPFPIARRTRHSKRVISNTTEHSTVSAIGAASSTLVLSSLHVVLSPVVTCMCGTSALWTWGGGQCLGADYAVYCGAVLGGVDTHTALYYSSCNSTACRFSTA
jgi:hypothetical protein